VDAEQLADIAAEGACLMRDYGYDRVRIWLKHTVPDPDDRERLLFVAFALIDVERPASQLQWWLHGTPAAAARHEARGEHMCRACRRWAAEPVSTEMPTGEKAA